VPNGPTSIRHVATTVVGQTQPVSGQVSPSALRSYNTELVPHKFEVVTPDSVQTPSQVAQLFQLMQRNASESTQSARSLPVLGGTYWPGLTLSSGTHSIAHGVQSATVSWLVGRMQLGYGLTGYFTVAGTASSGGAIEVATTFAHGFSTGDTVSIQGIVGTYEANGLWPVTVVDTTHFTLQRSFYVNAYSSGGIIRAVPPTISELSQDPTNGRISLSVYGQPVTVDLWFYPTPVAVRS
jgi:Ubiquitin-activating enzyme E1 FCCH domain